MDMTTDRLLFTGVVEGFYGKPWNARQRHQLFQWMKSGGLNAYLYAPKDDLKHRVAWREPYVDMETAELGALVRNCQRHGLTFIYAIAPGLDVRFSERMEQAVLVEKLTQLSELGVSTFAILFDDIPAVMSPADAEAFKTPARAQAEFTNAVAATVRATLPKAAFLFCPTAYCGRMATPSVKESPYLNEIGALLAPEIHVMWTGPEIISDTLPVESLQEVRAVLRRKPVLWDNLVANDYDMRRLYLGPYSGRTPAVLNELSGILLNPNCQFEANHNAVHTLATYLRTRGATPAAQASHQALDAWLPLFATHPPATVTREDLTLLCDLLHLPTVFGPSVESLLKDFAAVRQEPCATWNGADARIVKIADRIVRLYDTMTALRNRDLLHAFYSHLWEAKELALLIKGWTLWRARNPDPQNKLISGEFRPKLFRGSFGANIERLLPMDDEGRLG